MYIHEHWNDSGVVNAAEQCPYIWAESYVAAASA